MAMTDSTATISQLLSASFIKAHTEWSVREVLDQIRQNCQKSDALDVVYIVDSKGVLEGQCDIKDLLLNSLDLAVGGLVDFSTNPVNINDSLDLVKHQLKQSTLSSVAVVDNQRVLLGVIRREDLNLKSDSFIKRIISLFSS